MQPNSELRPTITRRQQQWINAHEREQQNRCPDVFGWWCDLRMKGRIEHTPPMTLGDELRHFNATQIADLPYSTR